ncbi:MAG TPA: translesion DNA synthesis-associated protein ImuA [Burkholderiales bacterium]
MAALEDILQRHPVWRGGALSSALPAVPTGFAELDRQLPGGGWPAGGLSEILGGREGIGELQLVLPALARLSWAGKRVVWLAPPHLPYAPALAAAGVDLAHLAVVRAPGRRDALWAAEQVLRSGSCHALLAWFPGARYEELRRLAVAAEAGRAWVALFRPPQAAQAASPSALRLSLEPAGDALCVHILKRRGAPAAAPLHLPLKRPVHALARTSFSAPAARHARGDRRLGLPVHA